MVALRARGRGSASSRGEGETSERDALGEVGDLAEVCAPSVLVQGQLAVLDECAPEREERDDAPQRDMMLKRELLPTLGMPTMPIWRLLLGRPSMAFFSCRE